MIIANWGIFGVWAPATSSISIDLLIGEIFGVWAPATSTTSIDLLIGGILVWGHLLEYEDLYKRDTPPLRVHFTISRDRV